MTLYITPRRGQLWREINHRPAVLRIIDTRRSDIVVAETIEHPNPARVGAKVFLLRRAFWGEHYEMVQAV